MRLLVPTLGSSGRSGVARSLSISQQTRTVSELHMAKTALESLIRDNDIRSQPYTFILFYAISTNDRTVVKSGVSCEEQVKTHAAEKAREPGRRVSTMGGRAVPVPPQVRKLHVCTYQDQLPFFA